MFSNSKAFKEKDNWLRLEIDESINGCVINI